MGSSAKGYILGNLTRDPEIKDVGGTTLCELSLAVNETWKNKAGEKQEHVSYLDCVAWGGTGDVIAKYLSKGDPLLVDVTIRQERWKNKEDQNRSKVVFRIDRMQFVGKKDGSSSSGGNSGGDSSPPATGPTGGSPPADDIPF